MYNQRLLLWRTRQMADDQLVTRLEEVGKMQADSWHPVYLLGMIHMEHADARRYGRYIVCDSRLDRRCRKIDTEAAQVGRE